MPKWKITAHWPVTGYEATDDTRKHYHACTEGDGGTVYGDLKPEDNIPPLIPGKYAAHTGGNNSYNIGLACCGMLDAEWGSSFEKVDFGPYPIQSAQFEEFCRLIAAYAIKYRVPVERGRIDTHAEVEMNRGVEQEGKWDIAYLKWRPDLKGKRAVGDFMRERVSQYVAAQQDGLGLELALPQHIPTNYRTAKYGERGEHVRMLQADLSRLGYHLGRIDGHFGERTRGALLAFQGDNGLKTDGIAGPRTYARLARAEPLSARDVTEDDLRVAGSKTIAQADTLSRGSKAAGGVLTVAGAADMASTAASVSDQASEFLPNLQSTLVENWLIILVIAVGVGVYFYGPNIAKQLRLTRVEDAASNAHLGR